MFPDILPTYLRRAFAILPLLVGLASPARDHLRNTRAADQAEIEALQQEVIVARWEARKANVETLRAEEEAAHLRWQVEQAEEAEEAALREVRYLRGEAQFLRSRARRAETHCLEWLLSLDEEGTP